jgi:hypothetical protein
VTPFDCYQTYLSLKNHFTKEKYDFFQYGGRTRASVSAFNKRKDKYWFEKLSRQKKDEEVRNYFIANFCSSDSPEKIWIGGLIKEGETEYQNWLKRNQSLTYLFTEQSNELFSERKLEDVFDCSKGHPTLLKKYLGGKISLETLVIYDRIFEFRQKFDKQLDDPIWGSVSLKLKKYEPFLNIDVQKHKQILRSIICE